MNTLRAGWHLLYDGHVEPEKANLLNDQEYLRKFLAEMVEFLGMKMLVEPVVKAVQLEPGKLWSPDDEGGVTGFCVITTSHISIHTWPIRERFSLDVFSCTAFNRELVEDFVKERLHVKNRWSHWIDRMWSQGEFNPAASSTIRKATLTRGVAPPKRT